MSAFKLFSGSANPQLGRDLAADLGVSLGEISLGTFSDGETRVEILENVRGRDIFILQSTGYPANDHVMELLIMADAFRRASAKSITAIVPYFGYARQDRRVRSSRVPITAKVVADMMVSVGISRVITADLHADQIQGFFCIPVDNIYASGVLLPAESDFVKSHPNLMVVSPDVGGVVRARAIAKSLKSNDLAIIDKRRPAANQAEVMNLIGDVSGRDCIIVDDIVDTAGTLCQAASALKAHGATTVSAYCTHPVLSGEAIDNINQSALDRLVVTDSMPLRAEAAACDKVHQVSLSPLLKETIARVIRKDSVSSMFVDSE